MIRTCLLLILFALNFENTAFAKNGVLPDDLCGGKYYPACESEDKNNLAFLNLALSRAHSENKAVLLILGSDWCGPCVTLQKQFDSNPDILTQLLEQFVTLKLDQAKKRVPVGTKSDFNIYVQQVSDLLNVSYNGIPHFLILKPKSVSEFDVVASIDGEVRTQFEAKDSSVSLQKFVNYLVKEKKTQTAPLVGTSTQEEIYIAGVNTAFLFNESSEISLAYDKKTKIADYGRYRIGVGFKSGYFTWKLKDLYFNQGINAYHAFHYVDAYRSLLMAKKYARQEPSIDLALALTMESLGEEGYGPFTEFNPHAKALIEQHLQDAYINRVLESSSDPVVRLWFLSLAEKYCFDFRFDCKQELIDAVNDYVAKNFASGAKISQELYNSAVTNKNSDLAALAIWNSANQQNGLDFDETPRLLVDFPGTLNPGIYHYLIHYYESKGEYQVALNMAEVFAGLLPRVPHAQHMVGHILPQLGRWKEAAVRFATADKLHREWFARHKDSSLTDDWHFPHNLDLYGHVQLFLGLSQYEKGTKESKLALTSAENIFKRLCAVTNTLAHCVSLMQFYVVTGDTIKIEPVIEKLRDKSSEESANAIKLIRAQTIAVSKTVSELKNYLLSTYSWRERDNNWYLKSYVMMADPMYEFTGKLEEQVRSSLDSSFQGNGFDSWSSAYMESLILQQSLARLGYTKVAKVANTIVESNMVALQSGLCSSSGTSKAGNVRELCPTCIPLKR